jgi:bacillithiol system protein YtxJ
MSGLIGLAEKKLPLNCFVFKHSTTCPISSRALIEVRAVRSETPMYMVNVKEQRELSDWIARKFNTVHESPQLLLIRNGKRAKVWNHWDIRREKIKE